MRLPFGYLGELPVGITDLLFKHTQQTAFSTMEVIQFEKVVQNLSLTLVEEISDTMWGPEGLEVNLNSLARIVTDEKIALDLLHVGQGRAYTITTPFIPLPGLFLRPRGKVT